MMFGPKKVADVVAQFTKVMGELQKIKEECTEESNKLVDKLHEVGEERTRANLLLGNFKQMVEGDL